MLKKTYFFLFFTFFLFCLTTNTLADDWGLNVPKKSVVVLKIPRNEFGFTKVSVWSGRSNYEASVSRKGGLLAVNGETEWQDQGWSLMTELIVKEVKKNNKQKTAEIYLENDGLKIKLNFDSTVTNIAESFDQLIFQGTLYEFENSNYYKSEVVAKFIPRIFKGRLTTISEPFKLQMLKASNYDTQNYGDEEFKGKYYLVVRDAAKTYFNTLRLNQTQRVSYVFNNALLAGFKEFAKNLDGADIDGIKFEYQIPYYNFVTRGDSGVDNLHIYVQLPDIKSFAESDITSQELLDKSIIIVNGNRTKTDLTQ